MSLLKQSVLLLMMILLGACAPKPMVLPTMAEKPNIQISGSTDEEGATQPRETVLSDQIVVNQVGYLPGQEKGAIYISQTAQSVAFEVLDGQGRRRYAGRSVVLGPDEASGDNVHYLDFSDFTESGSGYTVSVAGRVSYPFSIADDLYQQMSVDALRFFYHQRSGVPIEMPFAGGEKWVRPAGHPGDRQVTCVPVTNPIFTEHKVSRKLACKETVDASGGWYDAGDHGKYVVNGAGTAWLLLHLFERLARYDPDTPLLGDGELNIPEGRNNIPDLLDEVRFELEFLLRMQVQTGAYRGMFYHKLHDDNWTGIPMPPHKDPEPRHLYPVSTPATLDGVAVLAKAARVFKGVDDDFSKMCLWAAKLGYKAARAHKSIFAPPYSVGGGPYDDPRADDETYLAAVELYLSTGEEKFARVVEKSPHFLQIPTFLQYDETDGVFTWKDVAPLGTFSLLMAEQLPKDWEAPLHANLQKAADELEMKQQQTGYRIPLTPAPKGSFPWGSNSNIVNSLMVLVHAYDLAPNAGLADSVLLAMDYLLGRNPLNISYVTGYGSHTVVQPHHRFFAHVKDKKLPGPPPGIFAGGPNSGIQDDVAKSTLNGCAPARCYVDNIDSWSTNEIAINWNAAFSFVTAFVSGLDSGPAR